MTRTIFLHIFLVGVSVLLLCTAFFFGLQYTQTMDETYDALAQEISYAEKGIAAGGEEYLDSLLPEHLATWINAQGEVIYDSETPGLDTNQGEYPEVRDALVKGEGKSARRSESSGQDMLYYARRCADGTVLRMGRPTSALYYALVTVSPVLWVLVLVALISGVLAFRAAQQIVKPINELDLDHPKTEVYPELAPLIQKIQEQKLTIQEEVMQREEMRREFTANVTHELKTPLTSISGFAELMAEGVVSPDRVGEFSRDIYKESQRLISLIDDILKLSKLDENELGGSFATVDLMKVARDVTESLQNVASGIHVSLRVEGESVLVEGIEQLLNEMIYNLCDNAIKYNRPGGEVRVTVFQGEKKGISVQDNGIGIPKEDQKRVFERFYRVDKSHSKEVGGTGLGLSIVKHGAQLHGAEIQLESTPGVGTRITLFFPEKIPDQPTA